MRRTTRAAAAAALALTLGGCALSEQEERLADGLVPALRNAAEPSSEDRAECLAETWVGEVGTRPFVIDGLATEELAVRGGRVRQAVAGRRPVSREVAEGYAEAWLGCVDFDAISLDHADRRPEPSAEDLDDFADCLRELPDDLWRSGLVARLTGGDASGLETAVAECEGHLAP